MTARRLYVDTSAYLCVLLGERGHDALVDEMRGAELLSSALLVLEVRRNLTRHARNGALTASQLQDAVERLRTDVESFQLRDLTLDLCDQPTVPAVSTPRSLDLAHLTTALWFHAQIPITRFVTLDADQSLAARELSLPI